MEHWWDPIGWVHSLTITYWTLSFLTATRSRSAAAQVSSGSKEVRNQDGGSSKLTLLQKWWRNSLKKQQLLIRRGVAQLICINQASTFRYGLKTLTLGMSQRDQWSLCLCGSSMVKACKVEWADCLVVDPQIMSNHLTVHQKSFMTP